MLSPKRGWKTKECVATQANPNMGSIGIPSYNLNVRIVNHTSFFEMGPNQRRLHCEGSLVNDAPYERY